MIESRVDRRCRQSTIVATAFCTISVIWLLYYFNIRDCSINPFHHEKFSVAEELSRLVPLFPTHPVVFWNDSTYGDLRNVEDMSTDELDVLYKKWDDLIPRGLGLVSIDVGDDQDHLPPAIPYRSGTGPEKPYYFISVVHQLHCLESIMHALVQYSSQIKHQKRASSGHHDDHTSRNLSTSHAFHCLDYLRQSIMCCGDTALEGSDIYKIAAAEVDGQSLFDHGTSGIGATHICKDYQAIFNYAEKHTNPEWLEDRFKQELD